MMTILASITLNTNKTLPEIKHPQNTRILQRQ